MSRKPDPSEPEPRCHPVRIDPDGSVRAVDGTLLGGPAMAKAIIDAVEASKGRPIEDVLRGTGILTRLKGRAG